MAKDTVSFTDHPRKQHAIFAMMLAGAKWSGDPEKMLWECIGALTVYGTHKKLVEKGETIRTAAIINRDLPMNNDDRKRIGDALNELGGYILRLADGAGRIEEKVSALGFRVNPETGKVSVKQNRKGRDVVRARIWELYVEDYQAEYRKASTREKFMIRKKIGERPELTTYIEEHELRPDGKAGALIYDTIQKGEDRSN